MEKIKWSQMTKAFWKHNEVNNILVKGMDKDPLKGVVVYKASNWDQEYSLESRSYVVSSDNKAFIDGQISNSIFASNLDGTDVGVRLDWYRWEVDYCYLIEKEEDDGKTES